MIRPGSVIKISRRSFYMHFNDDYYDQENIQLFFVMSNHNNCVQVLDTHGQVYNISFLRARDITQVWSHTGASH
jgi:hypothetical protein